MAKKLSDAEIQERLRAISDWVLHDDQIRRRFEFKDFAESMAFVNRVAERAEAADHHPDITINWNKVTLDLVTHSAGGLTEKDFRLAGQINGLV